MAPSFFLDFLSWKTKNSIWSLPDVTVNDPYSGKGDYSLNYHWKVINKGTNDYLLETGGSAPPIIFLCEAHLEW